MFVCVCVHRVQCSRRTEEGAVSPGTGIMGSFNLLGPALGTEFRSSAPPEYSLNPWTFPSVPAAWKQAADWMGPWKFVWAGNEFWKSLVPCFSVAANCLIPAFDSYNLKTRSLAPHFVFRCQVATMMILTDQGCSQGLDTVLLREEPAIHSCVSLSMCTKAPALTVVGRRTKSHML